MPEAAKQTPAETTARRYISEITAAEIFWKKWRDRCDLILKRYEDDREESASKDHRYNIFWSNTETIKPACYARVPKATCLRRYNDSDQIARIAAEVMERAINFSSDCYDFDQVLKDVRDDFIILAKGTEWIRYEPQFGEADQTEGSVVEGTATTDDPVPDGVPAEKKNGMLGGVMDAIKSALNGGGAAEPDADDQPAPQQVVKYEKVCSDYVSYQDWGTNKCRKWSEVYLMYRIVYMNRAALVKRFGKKIGNVVTLDYKLPGVSATMGGTESDIIDQARVFEIWDKRVKKAVWISLGHPTEPLDEKDDPLGLEDFFPCPKPAFGTLSPRQFVPIADYTQYQDLQKELDETQERIRLLQQALRVTGMYAGDEKETLRDVFKPGSDNKMIPVEDWARFMDKGGIKGVVEWVPIDIVIKALEGLYKARDLTIAAIRDICAISDIMRGDTDAEETATAQKLKSTWGSSRMREKQKEMTRFCRDDMRIKGEIIAKLFSISTLKVMTNMELLTNDERQAIGAWQQAADEVNKRNQAMQQQAQQPPQPGMPPQPPMQMQPLVAPPAPFPPEKMNLMSLPTWEDVNALLKADGLRRFRIDIETDSTVEVDAQAARRDVAEFAEAFGTLMEKSLPVVQQAPPMGKVVAAMAKLLCRKWEAGREMEEVIEKAVDEIAAMEPQTPPGQEKKQSGKSPEEIAVMGEKVKVEQEKVAATREQTAVDRERNQVEMANSQVDAQTNSADVQQQHQKNTVEAQLEHMRLQLERFQTLLEAQTRIAESENDKEATIEAAAKKASATPKSN